MRKLWYIIRELCVREIKENIIQRFINKDNQVKWIFFYANLQNFIVIKMNGYTDININTNIENSR